MHNKKKQLSEVFNRISNNIDCVHELTDVTTPELRAYLHAHYPSGPMNEKQMLKFFPVQREVFRRSPRSDADPDDVFMAIASGHSWELGGFPEASLLLALDEVYEDEAMEDREAVAGCIIYELEERYDVAGQSITQFIRNAPDMMEMARLTIGVVGIMRKRESERINREFEEIIKHGFGARHIL